MDRGVGWAQWLQSVDIWIDGGFFASPDIHFYRPEQNSVASKSPAVSKKTNVRLQIAVC